MPPPGGRCRPPREFLRAAWSGVAAGAGSRKIFPWTSPNPIAGCSRTSSRPAGRTSWALAGGYALQAHGRSAARIANLDLATESAEPMEQLAGAARARPWRRGGGGVRTGAVTALTAQLTVTDPPTGDPCALALHKEACWQPPELTAYGPALSLAGRRRYEDPGPVRPGERPSTSSTLRPCAARFSLPDLEGTGPPARPRPVRPAHPPVPADGHGLLLRRGLPPVRPGRGRGRRPARLGPALVRRHRRTAPGGRRVPGHRGGGGRRDRCAGRLSRISRRRVASGPRPG
ncbi:hypothetical protein LT493_12925 [Streptomyces tricolor]|nr:hypothetical protein [Streptomyces tricolor]